jgi:hypothetical protein
VSVLITRSFPVKSNLQSTWPFISGPDHRRLSHYRFLETLRALPYKLNEVIHKYPLSHFVALYFVIPETGEVCTPSQILTHRLSPFPTATSSTFVSMAASSEVVFCT